MIPAFLALTNVELATIYHVMYHSYMNDKREAGLGPSPGRFFWRHKFMYVQSSNTQSTMR